MKITYFLTTADNAAGTERAIITQANSMAADGHDVGILSVYRDTGSTFFELDPRVEVQYLIDRNKWIYLANNNGVESNPNEQPLLSQVPSRFIPDKWDNQLNALTDIAINRALVQLQCDILVTSTPALTALAVQQAPPKVIVVEEEHRSTGTRGVTAEPILLFGPRADCIVSLTDESSDWLADALQAAAPNLVTIPNAIPDVFRPETSGRLPLIVAAGRFVPGKRFDHLIRAFAHAAPEHPDWRLRLYGSGPQEDAYRRMARRLGVESRLELIPPVTDMLSEWSKASIAALSSRSEGLPLVALEAIAAGVPVVSYDCPTGPSEIIDDGVNGRLIPTGDVQILAQALEELMGDSAKRIRMGTAAKASAARFSPDQIQKKWIELFTALLEEASDGSTRDERSLRRTKKATQLLNSQLAETAQESDEIGQYLEGSSELVLELSELAGHEVTQRNGELVRQLLDDADIRYVLLKGYDMNRSSMAVSVRDKERLLESLIGPQYSGLRVEALAGSRKLTPGYWEPAKSPQIPPVFETATTLRLFREYVDPEAIVRRGDGFACDVELWNVVEEEPGLLAPPRHNRVLDRLPESLFHTGTSSSTAQIHLPSISNGQDLPLWSEVNFPIDAVYTWVDDTDPQWRNARGRYLPENDRLHAEAASTARFTNRNELKYSLRSLRMFAPWIRKVYIVTAGQTPAWFAQADERVEFVSHDSLFPQAGVLPTFNSHAIETVLHRIDGLAEHFLYFNDDTILTRPQRPENYFAANGLSRFFTSPVKINYLGENAPPHLSAAANNRELIRQEFGFEISQSLLHTPYPHKRSVLDEMEAKYQVDFDRTRMARFRSSGDISLLSSLAQYYSYATGRAIPGTVDYSFVGLAREGTEAMMARILRGRRPDVLTLGEPNHGDPDPEFTAFITDQFLKELVPIPTDYERENE
ncbi:stealth conserved region 3 domain-containing protein [Crystallibacter degradans]|uniref:stealth conserved region 3 domain-containing protein n=1 Tax=Crystallibacter degradans TaxID=2726743 RepID=UPI001475B6E7|nr:stealth conserved region 3 domain-containing protein [Arthrobacter sp. SF27]NMR31278.1 glycosyltransferase [Arthrobacter sp. SF27]